MKYTIFLLSIMFLGFVTYSQKSKLDSFNNKYNKYYEAQKYNKALRIAQKTQKYAERKFGKNSLENAISLKQLGEHYLDNDEFNKSEHYCLNSILVFQNIGDTNGIDFANVNNTTGILYKQIGNYAKSLTFYQKSLFLFQQNLGDQSDYCAMVMNNMASLYRYLGNYNKAEQFALKAAEIYIKVYGDTSFYYSSVTNNLGNIYSDLYNFEKAEYYYKKTYEIRRKIYGDNHYYCAISLNNLGTLYLYSSEYQKAELYFQKALEIYKKAFGDKSYYYAKVLSNLGIVYKRLYDFEKSVNFHKKTLEILLEIFGNKSPQLIETYINLGILYTQIGDYSIAKEYNELALNMSKEYFGELNEYYRISLYNLAQMYYYMNDYTKAANFWAEYNSYQDKEIKSNFSFLTEIEKEKFLNKVVEGFDNFSSYVYKSKNKTFYGILYNNELNHKGMVLNSTAAFNEVVYNSQDTIIRNYYEKLTEAKILLSKMISLPLEERFYKTDSLEDICFSLEKKLNNRLSMTGIDNSFLKTYNWQLIQQNLKENEATIEFTYFKLLTKDLEKDTVIYCALVLTKNMKQPELVYLFEQYELENILKRDKEFEKDYNPEYSYIKKLYSFNSSTSDSLYLLIWQPIDIFLQNIKKIYISPSGLLNRIAFGALVKSPEKVLSDVYDINYVSSTVNIINHKNIFINDISTLALFGGITYNEDTTLMKKAAKNSKNNIKQFDSLKAIIPMMPVYWRFLEGSLTEVNIIDSMFEKTKVETFLFKECFATEEQFKYFSAKSPDIIHIATHGFYFEKDSSKVIGFNSNLQYVFSQNPLIRSGIILSGGNYAWTFNSSLAGIEDGVLTSYEISHLALFNTKLVVLSACQTGLGDLETTEGVYGLRRALKMAGVDYLILSLWSVPDKQTQELMSEFYRQFLNGIEIKEAFRNAQKFLKTKYSNVPGSAYAWAAFVLIE